MDEIKESYLSQYLGEHQQQAFFGLINIRLDKATWQTHKIGSVVPFYAGKDVDEAVDLTPSTCCLAMILHIFKRFSSTSLSTRSLENTRGSNTLDANSLQNHQLQSDNNVQDLITIKIYFHISHMKSVNEPKISADNRKRIYTQPHKDEYVIHPSQITMTIKEFVSRLRYGNDLVQNLIDSSSLMPSSLVKLSMEFRNNHDKKENDPQVVDQKKSLKQFPKFVVLSEGLYNRIKAIEKIQSEGYPTIKCPDFGWNIRVKNYSDNDNVNCDILNTMDKAFELFFCGICSIRPHFAVSKISAEDSEDVREDSSLLSSNSTTKCSIECKSCLQHINRNLISIWPLAEDTRFVFIRRQSNDFNIPLNSPNQGKINFTPAKIRRTRVRGTDQMAIKLRRPISIPENLDEEDMNDPLLKSLINDGLLFEQFDSYSSNSNSPHVRCNSPMLRPKRNCGPSISYAEIATTFSTVANGSSQSHLHHSQSDSNFLSEENQRSLRANPPANKRIKYIDKDLELAIQRSLVDKSKRRKKQTKSEEDSSTNPTSQNSPGPEKSFKKKVLTRSSSAVITKKNKSISTFRGRPRKIPKGISNRSSQDKSSPETSESEDGQVKQSSIVKHKKKEDKQNSLDGSSVNVENTPVSIVKQEDDTNSSPAILFSAGLNNSDEKTHSVPNTLNDSNEDAKTEPQTCCDDQVQMMYTNVNIKSPCDDDEPNKPVEDVKLENNTVECKPLPEYMPPLSDILLKPPPLNLPPDFLLPTTMWTLRNLPLPPPTVDQGLKRASQLLMHPVSTINNQSLSIINQQNNAVINGNNQIKFPQDPTSYQNNQSQTVFQNLGSTNLLTNPQASLQQIIALPTQNQNILSLQQALIGPHLVGSGPVPMTNIPSTPQSNHFVANGSRNNLIFTTVCDNLQLLNNNNSTPIHTNKLINQNSIPVSNLGLLTTTPSINFQIPPNNMNLILNSNGNQLRMPFSML